MKDLPNEMMVKDAEKILRLSGRQVRRLHSDGILEGQKVGRVLWLSTASVLRYNEERRPVGRPLGTISTAPAPDPKKREYDREYQRRRRRSLRRTKKGRGPGRAAKGGA